MGPKVLSWRPSSCRPAPRVRLHGFFHTLSSSSSPASPLLPPLTSQPRQFLPRLATFHDLARLGPEHCGSGRRHFGTETGCGGGKSGKRGLFKVPKTSSRDRAQRHPQARGTSGGAEGNTVPRAPDGSPGDERGGGGLPVSALWLEGVGSGVGGARRVVAGGPGGTVGRGAAALGVDSARRSAGEGGGSGEEVGGGPLVCGGVLGGGRERRRRPRRRAASGPGTRLPGHRPGGPGQVAAELGPGRALLAALRPPRRARRRGSCRGCRSPRRALPALRSRVGSGSDGTWVFVFVFFGENTVPNAVYEWGPVSCTP